MMVLVSLSYPVKIKQTVDEHLDNFRQSPDFLVNEGYCISLKIGDSFRTMCLYEVSDCRLEDSNHYFDEKMNLLLELPGFSYEFNNLSKINSILKLKGGL